MAWIYLVIGGLMEVLWAIGLKYSDGFTNPMISLLTIVGIVTSFYFFARALKYLPVGTAYAIFTGLGAAGTAVIGMMFLNESISLMKIFFIILLISSIIGLKLNAKEA
ncbi:QacE family quaternary ammonium compound efflux SMR transporter [Bacillus hwajinpoensis]|uniref:QacE family quaternary ammonium compound efflux SMR transporter n=1 Tax=Guptibacillus hwajinpoensis TaxID=208199 RepID=A0A845F1X9_9BACL|nr:MULTISPECIES: multidrug efflux SMR transporter [Bacillaceae]MYL64801.1 QacE family quaternary ammonium compound efflux SMR transporter [Pseudalkalibacillus hwajinpoensis]PFG11857.1 quaternary ammonium compound-resistance protein SugE [Bacillus sp. es.036]